MHFMYWFLSTAYSPKLLPFVRCLRKNQRATTELPLKMTSSSFSSCNIFHPKSIVNCSDCLRKVLIDSCVVIYTIMITIRYNRRWFLNSSKSIRYILTLSTGIFDTFMDGILSYILKNLKYNSPGWMILKYWHWKYVCYWDIFLDCKRCNHSTAYGWKRLREIVESPKSFLLIHLK